jgi:hypothetical protein
MKKYLYILPTLLLLSLSANSEECPKENVKGIPIYYDYQSAIRINVEVKLLLNELRGIDSSIFTVERGIPAKNAVNWMELKSIIYERMSEVKKSLDSIIRIQRCKIDNRNLLLWVGIAEGFSRSLIGLHDLENAGLLKHPNSGYFSTYFNAIGNGSAFDAIRNGVNGEQKVMY